MCALMALLRVVLLAAVAIIHVILVDGVSLVLVSAPGLAMASDLESGITSILGPGASSVPPCLRDIHGFNV